METNASIKIGTPLHNKGMALLKAAHEYWLEYRKCFQPGAVVFLEDESGHFVLFTRGEYKREILSCVDSMNEPPLEHPFELP